jgi:hypothetical protein
MNKMIVAVVAGMLAVAGASLYAAEPVKAAGETTAKEPGRVDDPASPEKAQQDAKEAVKAAGPHGETPGRAGDPCAAGRGTAAGGAVECVPEATAKEPGRQ